MKWLKVFESSEAGPTTVVVGMVHGNEIIGKYVHDRIEEICGKNNFKWEIISLLGNPEAYRQGKRFIDQDLNRSFGEYDITNTEIQRATEIKDYFKKKRIDYVFDIHSTPTESDPMIICTDNDKSLELVNYFPIKRVILGLIEVIEGTSLTRYFSEKGAVDFAFECWSHSNPNQTVADQIIETIFKIQNLQPFDRQFEKDKIRIYEAIKTSSKNFKFEREFQGFEEIGKWEVFATEWTKQISTVNDSIMVIPRPDAVKELEFKDEVMTGYLGKRIA